MLAGNSRPAAVARLLSGVPFEWAPKIRNNGLRNPARPAYLSPMNTMIAPASTVPAAESARSAALIDVQVSEIETVARDTNVYTFRRPDGAQLPPYKPGAHIDIHLPNGLIRQFSLLNPGGRSRQLRRRASSSMPRAGAARATSSMTCGSGTR